MSSSSALGRLQALHHQVSPAATAGAVGKLFQNEQVAIVTGSGQGIGAAAAKIFAREGARVVVTDIDAKKAQAVLDEIKSAGGKAISVPGDITDPAFPQKLIQETIKAFGKIHYIINNAGFTFDGMLHKMTDDQWNLMQTVHLTAPFRIIRAAAPYMRDAGKEEADAKGRPDDRCIINISSTSGLHGNVGQVNYSAAKSGVLGMTKTIAKEWGGFGVRCNAVAFGLIDTRLTRAKEAGETIEVDGKKIAIGIPTKGGAGHNKDGLSRTIPLGRAGQPEEAAGAVVMLCSPYSSYVSGHCLEVTGGMGI